MTTCTTACGENGVLRFSNKVTDLARDASGEWAPETVCMRMKDATFDIDVESGENNLER